MNQSRLLMKIGTITTIVGAVVFGAVDQITDRPEISERALSLETQIAYESEVATFLGSFPEPRSGDYDHSVEGRNAYWQATAAWWQSVPWVAVAGQWGCTSHTHAVTFNPPDLNGVITAGHGGIGRCQDSVEKINASHFTTIETRTITMSSQN